MAEEKGEARKDEAVGTTPPGGDLGTKRIVTLVLGALIVFVLSIPFHMYVHGMLVAESPYVVPAEGYALSDSARQELEAQVEQRRLEAEARRAREKARLAALEQDRVEDSPGVDSLGAGSGGPDGRSPAAGDDSLDVEGRGGDGIFLIAPDVTDSTGAVTDPLLPFDASKLTRLVRVYEKMRPKPVAMILTTMPERQAVLILANMKDQKAAKVLAEIEPGKAARISDLLMRGNRVGP